MFGRKHKAAYPLQPDVGRMLLMVGAALVLAVVAGVAASTGKIAVVALMGGLVIGLLLLARPEMAVWILLAGGLVFAGLFQMFLPQLARIHWALAAVGFMLWAAALVLLSFRHEKVATPGFIHVALAFVALALFTSVANATPLIEVFAGFKRYFQAWGLMFALAFIPFTERDVSRWRLFILAVALLQLPFAVYEHFVLVPARLGIGHGIVPIDVVAGTFGANLEGGGSNATMAAFLVIVAGFVVAAWREKVIPAAYAVPLAAACIAPLFLGETKVSLLYIVVVTAVIFYRDALRKPAFFAVGSLAGVALVAVLLYVYATLYSRGLSPEEMWRQTVAYNFGERGHGGWYLNRTTALTFWWHEHGWGNPLQTLLGHGLGSSHSGQGGLVSGSVHAQYPLMGIGLTAASTLLWDVGLVGVMLILLMLYAAFRQAGRMERETGSSTVCWQMSGIRAAIAVIGIWLFYKSSLISQFGGQLVMTLVLGYLAFLAGHRAAPHR